MTKIPYLDAMWSVTTGCGDDMVSPGCHHCYARRMFGRNLWTEPCPDCDGSGALGQAHNGREVSCEICGGHEDALGSGKVPQTFTPTFHADRLDKPLHWRKPRRIGVSFMGDLFHEAITPLQIGRVLDTVTMCPQHSFLVLTKRPERMREIVTEELRGTNMSRFLNDKGPVGPLPNLWLGVTVCNQAEADRLVPILLATPAAKRWASIEPMLSAVYGDHPKRVGYEWSWRDLDWVVCGPETGPGKRPFDPQWAVDVKAQCDAAGVPYFDKRDEFGHWREMPAVTP